MTPPLDSSYSINTMGCAEMSFAGVRATEAFKHNFSERWADFLRSEFPSARHVAVASGVTTRTAENWLAGSCKPSGDTVALFSLRYPEAMSRFMRGKAL